MPWTVDLIPQAETELMAMPPDIQAYLCALPNYWRNAERKT
jgi:hypothetical protein